MVWRGEGEAHGCMHRAALLLTAALALPSVTRFLNNQQWTAELRAPTSPSTDGHQMWLSPPGPSAFSAFGSTERKKRQLWCCAKRCTAPPRPPVGSPQPQHHSTAPPLFPTVSPRAFSGGVFVPYPIDHGCATPNHPGKAPFSPPSAAPSPHPARATHRNRTLQHRAAGLFIL